MNQMSFYVHQKKKKKSFYFHKHFFFRFMLIEISVGSTAFVCMPAVVVVKSNYGENQTKDAHS